MPEFCYLLTEMGRPRKPTHLKVVQGTAQPCRLNPNEPEPEVGAPPMPDDLPAAAQKKWAELVEDIGAMGTLHTPHRDMLAGACRAYAVIVECEETLKREGYWVEKQTVLARHPALAALFESLKIFKSHLVEFGLSPASMSKVSASKPKRGADGWDKL